MKAFKKVFHALDGRKVPMARTSGIVTGFGASQEGIAVVFPKFGTREFREQADSFKACGIHLGLVTETKNGSLVDCSVYESHRLIAEGCGVLEA